MELEAGGKQNAKQSWDSEMERVLWVETSRKRFKL